MGIAVLESDFLNKDIDIDDISLDVGTQSRNALSQAVIKEYAAHFSDEVKFPPIILFQDGEDYLVGDGWHRIFGAQKAGQETISANIYIGTKRDAILYSLRANAEHGLRRTNKDKRKAVETLFADPEWAEWSNREIARTCGVARSFVNNMRIELTGHGGQSDLRKGADGRTINTSNIGTNENSESGADSQEISQDRPANQSAAAAYLERWRANYVLLSKLMESFKKWYDMWERKSPSMGQAFRDYLSAIEEKMDGLENWSPANLVDCPKCNGTQHVYLDKKNNIVDRASGIPVRCTFCSYGKVGQQ